MLRTFTLILVVALAGACAKKEREVCSTALYVEVTEAQSIIIDKKTIDVDGLKKALKAESRKCDGKQLRVVLGGAGLADTEASKPVLKAISASDDVAMVGFTTDEQ